jgi:hypothetical protein
MFAVMPMLSLAVESEHCYLNGVSEVSLKWDMFPSEMGLYTVEALDGTVVCPGVSPTLHFDKGQSVTFYQTDASNWYHPVGFAYEAGGAHSNCGPGDAECPELGGEEDPPGGTLQYHVKKPEADEYTLASEDEKGDDVSGFGLDAYEPLFFYPLEEWKAYGFRVALTVPDVQKFYYFCHIHAKMSAEIIVDDASENAPMPTRHDDFFVAPPHISEFDSTCGTVGISDFSPEHQTCSGKHFLCGEGLADPFNKCLQAIDCKMHHDMAVSTDTDPVHTFMRQMIPHHANAVSMAKTLLKHANVNDDVKALAMAIINVQNHQIQDMEGYLGSAYDATKKCYDEFNPCPTGCVPAGQRRHLLFASSSTCGTGCVLAR